MDVELYHTEPDGSRRWRSYSLPPECNRIIVDAEGIFGDFVWGFVAVGDDPDGRQVEATLLETGDGIVLG